ncbi:MAG: phytoene/squalene synthase family protein [Gammaproteobacteria bacterium]
MKSKPSCSTFGYQADLKYQSAILKGVSRTFALTIPVLPEGLSEIVTNAYLLCRLADTIEDDSSMSSLQKSGFHQRFIGVVKGLEDPGLFSKELLPLLSSQVSAEERDLVCNADKVIRITQSFSFEQREIVVRCVGIMCSGMPKFHRNKSLRGLKNLDELASYCYFVAGVVGEMLTELFCLYCPKLKGRHDEMMELAVSFGQGLQMTNILKDIWDDRQAEKCWLPRSAFKNSEFELERFDEFHDSEVFRCGLHDLVAVAHGHLQNALQYTYYIPRREVGIRRFCFWSIGLAMLTLRNIHREPAFTSGSQVKVSRHTVKATITATNLVLRSNWTLRMLFALVARGVPLAAIAPQSGSSAVFVQR